MADNLSSTVATWTLTTTQSSPAENHLVIGPNADGIQTVNVGNTESVLLGDPRKLVDPADIKQGGKYYSIVKLQIRYEKQGSTDDRWAQGSGWLIAPDLLVTAGHCSYDHTYQLGKAVKVKAYVGYNGKDSIGTGDVQFRQGKRIMTTSGWIQSELNRQNDVSLIQLDTAFNNVIPFTLSPTPVRGPLTLGVVGYPADKHDANGEFAAQMFAQFSAVSFDLDMAALHMLEYPISTYGGQSGSPVLIEGQQVSVGVHVYGLGTKNSASVIRGQYGNFIRNYQAAFAASIPQPSAGLPYTVLNLPGAESSLPGTGPAPTPAEDFWSTFKQVVNVGAKVGQTVLSVGTPFLGPVGAPIAAIAGTALGFASKLTESSMGTESAMSVDYSYKQHASRAILSEAALQTLLRMDPSTQNGKKVFQAMQTAYLKHKPHVANVAKQLGPTLMEPALRIALSSTAPAPTGTMAYPVVVAPGTESTLDPISNQIAQNVSDAAASGGNSEGFIDFLGSVVKIGTQVAPPVLSAIGSILGAVGGESSMGPTDNDLEPHLEILCHRALMGDAALQALMTLPPTDLKQEGFFGAVLDSVKSIGSTVLKVAPGVIRAVAPIVQSALQAQKGGESSLQPQAPAQPGVQLKSPRSMLDLLNDPALHSFPSVDGDGMANDLKAKVSFVPNGVSVNGIA